MDSNVPSAAQAARECSDGEAFTKLSSPLTEKIVHMAAIGDIVTMASCKAVCKEWRDAARGASKKLVVQWDLESPLPTSGSIETLQRALAMNPYVDELEVFADGWQSWEGLHPLTLRAWSSVSVFPDNPYQWSEGSRSALGLTNILSASFSSLKSLLLSDMGLPDPSFLEPFVSSLWQFTGLEKLTFSGTCRIEHTKFIQALQKIAPMVSVTELSFDLSIRQPLLRPESLSLLPNVFPNIEALMFPDHKHLSETAFLLLFRSLPYLKKLDIRSLSVPHLEVILSRLAQHCTSLQQLTLGVPLITRTHKNFYQHAQHPQNTTLASIPAKRLLELLNQCPSVRVFELQNLPLMPHMAWSELLEHMGGIEVLRCSFDFHDIPKLASLKSCRGWSYFGPKPSNKTTFCIWQAWSGACLGSKSLFFASST